MATQATSSHPLVPLGEPSQLLHWHSAGILAPVIRVTGASYDATRGSSFTVSFVPPACWGTAPCVANPKGYTVHWQIVSDQHVPKDRRYSKHYVSILEGHRLEPAKVADARGRDASGRPAALVEATDYSSYTQECGAPGYRSTNAADAHQQAPVSLQHAPGATAPAVGGQPPSCDCEVGYSWSTKGTLQVEHRIIAQIQCPPAGHEDDIGRRLIDGESYRVWVTVECEHVQPASANVTSNEVVIDLPQAPGAVFLTHEVLLNNAATRCMELYGTLIRACQEREDLLSSIAEFDRRAIQPERLWDKSTNLILEQRTRKANIRKLLHLEHIIRTSSQEHDARRKDAGLTVRVKWGKPREHGAVKVRRFVLQILEEPWSNAEIMIPSYVDLVGKGNAIEQHPFARPYEAVLPCFRLGKRTTFRMFAIGAAQDAQRFTVVMAPSSDCAGVPPGVNLKGSEVSSVRNSQPRAACAHYRADRSRAAARLPPLHLMRA